jgi:HAD superfamily hydrolase (TIGR01509 family)
VIRAVAWDIDGTLVDSEGLHQLALVDVSSRHGVHLDLDDPRFIGVSMDQVWLALSPLYPSELSQSAWMEDIVAGYLRKAERLRAFPGALIALEQLRESGIRQCCVSNSGRAVVDRNLRVIGADTIVEFSISRDDVVHGKPDPAPYLLACRRLELAPAEVLVVEDSTAGMASGRAAGCRVMRVGDGHCGFTEIVHAATGGTSVDPTRSPGEVRKTTG